MIESVRLQNFQIHESLEVPVKPGLNVIVGPTDTGKSSVIRAIRWIALHTPGTRLTRHGTKSMKAGVVMDGQPVIRFRGNENGYWGAGKKYVAVGTDQPTEIVQLLNLAPINFQAQHDPPFLITLSPGQIAKELNQIWDIGALDKCQAWLKSKATGAQQEVARTKDLLESRKTALDDLRWAEDAVVAVTLLRSLYEEIEALGTRRRLLGLRTEEVIRVSDRIDSFSGYSEALAEIAFSYGQMRGAAQRNTVRRQSLSGLLVSLRSCEREPELIELRTNLVRVVDAKKSLETRQQILVSLKTCVQGMENLFQKFQGNRDYAAGLRGILSLQQGVKDFKNRLAGLRELVRKDLQHEELIKTNETKIQVLQEKIGAVCPVCGK